MKLNTLTTSLLMMAAAFMVSCTNQIDEKAHAQNAETTENGATAKPDSVPVVKDSAYVMNRYNQAGTEDMGNNNPGRKIIYLTFDDGPSDNTPKVLNILKEHGVKATFFVTGHHTDKLNLIGRAYREGHAIAAHTATHNYNIYRSMETYFEDLEKVEQVIEKQTGKRTNIIRFPGGSSNTVFHKHNSDPLFMIRLTQEVIDRGYQYVDWNISSADASGGKVPTQTIIEHSCRARHNDLCLLMHDTYGKETTVEALPTIIEYYKKQGYEFGTITEKSYVCHHGIKPYGMRKSAASKPKSSSDTTKSSSSSSATSATTGYSSSAKSSSRHKDEKTEPAVQQYYYKHGRRYKRYYPKSTSRTTSSSSSHSATPSSSSTVTESHTPAAPTTPSSESEN